MITLSSRDSELALAQANEVKDIVETNGFQCRIISKSSLGDQLADENLSTIGGKGLFTKNIEEDLYLKKAEFAVHSAKDMPAQLVDWAKVFGYLPRSDARDALILKPNIAKDLDLEGILISKSDAKKLSHLTLATSSPRRAGLAKRYFLDSKILPIRGNIQTRIKKFDENDQLDGLFIASAAIKRLNVSRKHFILCPNFFVPCGGQGAIMIESRDDYSNSKLKSPLNCEETHLAVALERKILARLGASCTTPIGVYVQRQSSDIATENWRLDFYVGTQNDHYTASFNHCQLSELFAVWEKQVMDSKKARDIFQELNINH